MSSDSELEPTPPKQRRLVRPKTPGSLAARPVEYGISNILASDGGDDTSFTGSEQVASTSKDSTESNKNVEREDGASSSNSVDSDMKEVDKCPICWLPYTNQEIATPSVCDHRFCLHCLMEWSRTTNTCPVDRLTFDEVIVRPNFGNSERRVKVTRREPDLHEDERFPPRVFYGAPFELSGEESSTLDHQDYESSVEFDTSEDENSVTVSSHENDTEEELLDSFMSNSPFSNEIYASSPEYHDLPSSPPECLEFESAPLDLIGLSSSSSECNEITSAHADFNELSLTPSECYELSLSPPDCNEIPSSPSECDELSSSPQQSNELSPSPSEANEFIDELSPSPSEANEFINELSPSPSESNELSSSCSEPFSALVASHSPPSPCASISSASSFISFSSSSTCLS